MSKRLILALAFVASTAWAQQNVDISAEQFNSGDANGTLASLGRQPETSLRGADPRARRSAA